MKHVIHRDQIHRDVYFDPLSIALINTPQMQRLGRIYQLGFAHLVYRGGTHTRLSHVMGVAHVADSLVKQLNKNYEIAAIESNIPTGAINPIDFLPKTKHFDKSKHTLQDRWEVLSYLVRWGALLHDIGHIPLGHTLEDEFSGIYLKHDSFKSERIPYLWHEIAIGKPSPIADVFRDETLYPSCFKRLGIRPSEVWRVVMLICLYKDNETPSVEDETVTGFLKIYKESLESSEEYLFHQYMADIVADTICADYIDYLQRDTENVGLDTVKDIRIVQSYYIGKDIGTKKMRMALSLKDKGGKQRLSICTAAKNMVRHRFDLAEIIYYHKTKVSASAMLAKVFSLIEKPQEIGKPRNKIDILNISKYLESLINRSIDPNELKKSNIPDSLLDPSIGDETLLFWLKQKAWDKVLDATQNKNEQELQKALLAISLIEGIIERRLYKVAISINADLVGRFEGTEQATAIENKIENILEIYRKNITAPDSRDYVEHIMASSSGFPYGSYLVYIPGRKAQAKGIETGALDDNGGVVTLGNHSTVINDVRALNEEYKNLWKILVYIHPEYRNNYVELSKAVDSFLKIIFPQIDCRRLVNDIKKACWFPYIAEHNRDAADIYKDVKNNSNLNWSNFDNAKLTTTGTIDSKEHAYRALLLEHLEIDVLKRKFGDPGSLHLAINKELEPIISSESHKGTPQNDDIIIAIENIANKILTPNLFNT